MLPQQYNGSSVTVTGGAGTILTFKTDGTYTADFANSEPYTATTADGHQLSLGVTGVATGTFTTSFGQLSLMDTRTTLTVTLEVDGAVTSTTHPSNASLSGYTCSAGKLKIFASDSESQYAPAGG